MTELEKLEAGLEYDYTAPELSARKHRAAALCDKLETIPVSETAARAEVLRELFGHAGEGVRVMHGFHCDDGKNISVGDNFMANYNVSILDRAKVRIGDNALIAPGTVITTVNHALTPKKRAAGVCTAKPVVIGSDVWIGANTFINVSRCRVIGDGAIVAAGAVVNGDVPPYAVVGGAPARVLKFRYGPAEIETLLRVRWWDWDRETMDKYAEELLDPEKFFETFG